MTELPNTPTFLTAVEACPWCSSPRKAPGLAAFECGVTATTIMPAAVRPSQAAPRTRISDQTPICRTVMELRSEVERHEQQATRATTLYEVGVTLRDRYSTALWRLWHDSNEASGIIDSQFPDIAEKIVSAHNAG